MDFLEKTVEESDDRDSKQEETPTKLTVGAQGCRLARVRDFQKRGVVREREMVVEREK
uniref:Uncharacterized protein n=1 Tax=Fagus sylvatica TaxID=28930 RepID=A0A2N9FVF4_FAGSY